MTAPTPPHGAVAVRPGLAGDTFQWRHSDQLPYLMVRGRPVVHGHPASVDIATGPATQPLNGVSDPRELDACITLLAAARDWLAAQAAPETPDAQLSLLEQGVA